MLCTGERQQIPAFRCIQEICAMQLDFSSALLMQDRHLRHFISRRLRMDRHRMIQHFNPLRIDIGSQHFVQNA
ncbi:hypothetical protein D3C73_1355990 [compost metagenome]